MCDSLRMLRSYVAVAGNALYFDFFTTSAGQKMQHDTLPSPEPDLSANLRQALRRLAKAVVIITCKHEGKRFAMAATAVCEISFDPPSLLICVSKSASIHAPLSAGANFGVNILHASHEYIAILCSGKVKGEERFTQGAWQESPGGLPYIADAQACFLCRQDGSLSYGTHDIFIGRIESVSSQGKVDPLIYVDGQYAVASNQAAQSGLSS